jgi:hypothetical protein
VKRLFFALVLAACRGGTTEPSFPQGAFRIFSVNGRLTAAPIDLGSGGPFDPGPCPALYFDSTIFLGNEPTASIHVFTGVACSTTMTHVDKPAEYSIRGTAFVLRLTRDSIRYIGTASANRDTITLDSLPDYSPNHSGTGRFVFVRTP